MSPNPATRTLLQAALAGTGPREISAALASLGASGDAAAGADIAPFLKATHLEVRWMAATVRLGCLTKAALEGISRDDPDTHVCAAAVRHLHKLHP